MGDRGLELLTVDDLGQAGQANSKLGEQDNDGQIYSSQRRMAPRKRNEESSKGGLR